MIIASSRATMRAGVRGGHLRTLSPPSLVGFHFLISGKQAIQNLFVRILRPRVGSQTFLNESPSSREGVQCEWMEIPASSLGATSSSNVKQKIRG